MLPILLKSSSKIDILERIETVSNRIRMNIVSIPVFQKRDLLYLVLLSILVLCSQPSISFYRSLPLDEDTLLFFYPLRYLHHDPQVGLWDPYLFCGFPRDANPQSQLLYVPNLLFYWFPPEIVFPYFIIGHLFIGGACMILLLRGLKLSPEAAFFGATAFVLSTFWRCKITNLGLLEGICWVPGFIFFYALCLETQKSIPVICASFLFALVILAGVPHTVVYTLIFMGIITLGFLVRSKHPPKSIILKFGSTLLLTALLTIGMWFPALLYYPESSRSAIPLAEALEGSIPWYDIWKVFLGGLTQPHISRCDPWEGACYIGATALFFIPFGWPILPLRLQLIILLSILVSILFTLGGDGGLFPLLYTFAPGWNALNLPNRALLMAAICLPILGAFGFQRISANDQGHPCKPWILLSVSAICFGLFLFWMNTLPHAWITLRHSALTDTFQSEFMSDAMWAIVSLSMWVGLSAFLVFLYCKKLLNRHVLLASTILLLSAQAIQYSPRLFLQTTTTDFYSLPVSVKSTIDSIRDTGYRTTSFIPMVDRGDDVRMRYIQTGFFHRLPEVFGIHEIQGYDPLYPRSYGELIRAWAGQSRQTHTLRTIRLDRYSPSLMNFLSVRYIVGFPNQDILYTGQSVEQDGIGTLSTSLQPAREIDSIHIRWLLAGASEAPHGLEVARVHVMHASETLQTFSAKAGIHVANYLIDPDEFPSRHAPAETYRWFPIPSSFGYLRVRQYLATFPLEKPVKTDRLSIECLIPSIRYVIQEVGVNRSINRPLSTIATLDGIPMLENEAAFPPAYLSRKVVSYSLLDELISHIDNLQPDDEKPVFFNQNDEITFETSPVDLSIRNDTVAYRRIHSDRIQIDTKSQYDGLLVVNESYSPNWKATVDDLPVPVYRANHTFMAIPIPMGSHRVELHYLPLPFYICTSISGAVCCLLLTLLLMYPNQWLYPASTIEQEEQSESNSLDQGAV